MIEVMQEEVHVLGVMAHFVPSVALVVDPEVELEGPRHGDESKIPKVRQFAGVATMKNETSKDSSDGFVFVGQVQVDAVLDLADLAPGILVVQYG